MKHIFFTTRTFLLFTSLFVFLGNKTTKNGAYKKTQDKLEVHFSKDTFQINDTIKVKIKNSSFDTLFLSGELLIQVDQVRKSIDFNFLDSIKNKNHQSMYNFKLFIPKKNYEFDIDLNTFQLDSLLDKNTHYLMIILFSNRDDFLFHEEFSFNIKRL